MPDNANYSKKQNIDQRKIIANNINFKETRSLQVTVNKFSDQQHSFQRHK